MPERNAAAPAILAGLAGFRSQAVGDCADETPRFDQRATLDEPVLSFRKARR